jgi:hypothetical protein
MKPAERHPPVFIKIKDHNSSDRTLRVSHEDELPGLPPPANDALLDDGAPNEKILAWLCRLARPGFSFEALTEPLDRAHKMTAGAGNGSLLFDDWQTIANICGHAINDFIAAGAALPLTAAEIDHFRRNHRGTENHISRDFLASKIDLPSPLAELYGLYLHRARVDAEATLFVAQSTGSTRVARTMADLLAIGGFANGLEYITYLGLTYAVPAAFDTSDIIDRANHEAARRLALPAAHPSHLLKLTPDEISILAVRIAEPHALSAPDFLEKANLLAESRQDVTRLPVEKHFTTAIIERDLPIQQLWVTRLCAAYARIFEGWVAGLPEIDAIVGQDSFSA